jgi:hypothetical protein
MTDYSASRACLKTCFAAWAVEHHVELETDAGETPIHWS